MKFFLVFIAGFCAVSVYANPAVVNTGHSAQFRSQDVSICFNYPLSIVLNFYFRFFDQLWLGN